MSVKSFKDLECWKAGREFRLFTAELCKNFPSHEKFGFTSQLQRSSRSVCDNIAEGYGRFHFQENIQYCRQARGSLNESLNQCITAFDEGNISNENLEMIEQMFERTNALLNGYINFLSKAKIDQKIPMNK
jgi:four helix bundle protein